MVSIRIILAGLLAVLSAPALAQIDAAPKVQAKLIGENTEIAPGGTVTVALEESIRPGWHTYWRNPGEAGAPTEIAWQLPRGWRAGGIEWPYPKRLPAGPLMNFGYEGKPWLLVPITAPASAKPDDNITLRAHVSWLVCSDTLCVPEDADLVLPLSISDHPAPAYATIAQQFDAARALLPRASPWPVVFHDGAFVDVFLAAPKLDVRRAEFFPFEEGALKTSAQQKFGEAQSGLVLRLVRAAKAKPLHSLGGVLVLTSGDGSIQALTANAAPGVVPAVEFPDDNGITGALAFLFAFLGGLILNLMPCVLPILAMKALAVASHANADHGEAAQEGLSYGAGAILSFLALGLAVVLLRAGGEAVGWGFQLQESRVVAGFALLMFAVGLNLSGVFELPAGVSAGDGLTRQGGVVGAFFTGVLAVAVAAPCTAPFMAAAIGYALTQGTLTALSVFFFLGLGFVAPFVAIGFSPALRKLLPRPGPWMIRLKQVLAFPMYGAAAWLAWVVALEAGQRGLAVTLAAMLAFAFGAWAWTASRNVGPPWRGAGTLAGILGLILAIAGVVLAEGDTTAATAASSVALALHGEPYSAARLEQLRGEHRPVFVDATAAWCITCLVNEKVALSGSDVREAFARTHTTYLVADWTKRDAGITALLAAHDHPGVPLYLYYKPGAADAEVLPQILTPQTVLAAVNAR
jgi:thiol:disulfide interchange protein